MPFDSEDSQGIVYVWIGKRANAEEARLAEEIADDMYGVSQQGPGDYHTGAIYYYHTL